MKLLVVTGFEDYTNEILQILKKAEIHIFSKSQMSGFKNNFREDNSGNWFAAGHNEYNAVMIFAFTEAEKAERVLELVQSSNDQNTSQSKIRAFLTNVEKAV